MLKFDSKKVQLDIFMEFVTWYEISMQIMISGFLSVWQFGWLFWGAPVFFAFIEKNKSNLLDFIKILSDLRVERNDKIKNIVEGDCNAMTIKNL